MKSENDKVGKLINQLIAKHKMKTQEQAKPVAHTPGPWFWNPYRWCIGQQDPSLAPDYDNRPVAFFHSKPTEANARLIAAAPDGYEFAKRFLRDGWRLEGRRNTPLLIEMMNQAEAFVAKVEERAADQIDAAEAEGLE